MPTAAANVSYVLHILPGPDHARVIRICRPYQPSSVGVNTVEISVYVDGPGGQQCRISVVRRKQTKR
jgi:hypothetical protein